MRLWSLHPKYLDTKGLLAVWREGLLAQKVLAGKTKGYRNHPQLLRFRSHSFPERAMGRYLLEVWEEARRRGYAFTKSKVKNALKKVRPIPVTKGQVRYEMEHLRKKLRKREPRRSKGLPSFPLLHPLFRSVPGVVESWEKR